MSVDEMIEIVTVQNSYTFGGLSDEGKAIIAALRAGQAMRDSFEPIDDDDFDSYAVNIDRRQLSQGGQAWDAATAKGDDK